LRIAGEGSYGVLVAPLIRPRDRYPREVTDLLPEIAILAGFAAIMAGLVWLTHRGRGRRVGSSVAGPFEEIWHPAAHRARIDIEIQDDRKAPIPSPGDPPGPGTFPPDPHASQ